MIVCAGEVLSHKKYGEHFHSLTIVAPEVGDKVRPGQFVNIRCGHNTANILRRPFSVYRVHKRGGWAPTIEIVFDVRGPGSKYLSELRGHEPVDLIGPLGRGFALPGRRANCLLVGGGVGAAPLFFLADELRGAGHRVDFILGARESRMLLNPIDVRRLASVYRITTEDGSQGEQGRVTDVLDETIERTKAQVVYTCGPHPMLAAVSGACVRNDIPVQVAVEELMACGYGVCMTCVMPIRSTRSPEEVHFARSCTEGPVFNGGRVVWGDTNEPLTGEETELVPAGAPSRHDGYDTSAEEHPPPGN